MVQTLNCVQCDELRVQCDSLASKLIKLDVESNELCLSGKLLSNLVLIYTNRINKLTSEALKKRNLANYYLSTFNDTRKYNLFMYEAVAIEETCKKIDQEKRFLELLANGNISDVAALRENLTATKTEANAALIAYRSCLRSC